MTRCHAAPLFVCLFIVSSAMAQDPVGAIEGLITDSSASAIAGAHVTAKNLNTFAELRPDPECGTSPAHAVRFEADLLVDHI